MSPFSVIPVRMSSDVHRARALSSSPLVSVLAILGALQASLQALASCIQYEKRLSGACVICSVAFLLKPRRSIARKRPAKRSETHHRFRVTLHVVSVPR